ncbi:hypothetical protein SAMN05660742_12271 [Propionispira arboris]|uniref:Uncharacterized protein n=1 Tax=Propionispira arboris TaxID=84035 RepID=A0A1H7CRP4_9FIRM|nr:hypothetical protein [Propionispira arboris]SEJ89822.1 hypothetical protein SAMN05660742_12271 [Propionispira arboris]
MAEEVHPIKSVRMDGKQVAAGIQIETRGRQVLVTQAMGLTASNAEPGPPPPMVPQNSNNGK